MRAGALAVVAGVLTAAGAVVAATAADPRPGRLVVGDQLSSRQIAPGANADPPSAAGRGSSSTAPVSAYLDWARATADGTEIPARALAAYAAAQVRLERTRPGCRLGWVTLAGIGAVESAHAGVGGGLRPSGRPVSPVIGVALDGSRDVSAIIDTDDGTMDGDTLWDRAVGPLQFLPSTWDTYGADGDRDGVRDPQDIDDGSLAAGRYLCAGGTDLTDPASWEAAVLSYNASSEYLAAVFTAADGYAAAAG